jgi:hypothetical protein
MTPMCILAIALVITLSVLYCILFLSSFSGYSPTIQYQFTLKYYKNMIVSIIFGVLYGGFALGIILFSTNNTAQWSLPKPWARTNKIKVHVLLLVLMLASYFPIIWIW